MNSETTSIFDFGLSEEVILKIQSVFQSHPKIEKCLIYGSRAKGNFRYNSDIDLTLVGKKLSLSDQLKVENELDDLLLPYKIDLSIFHTLNHPGLIDHINRVGLLFYKKS